MVNRVAVGLYRLGIRPSDVVAVQLPNWWEFTVTHLACRDRRSDEPTDAYFPGA